MGKILLGYLMKSMTLLGSTFLSVVQTIPTGLLKAKYMFIDTGKIVGELGNNPPVMTNTVSVEIDLAREIYERLLSKGWRKIEKNWN